MVRYLFYTIGDLTYQSPLVMQYTFLTDILTALIYTSFSPLYFTARCLIKNTERTFLLVTVWFINF